MKRRILSLVLALMMCFTVLSTAVVAENEIELMGLSDTLRLYTERVWDWQEGQFNAMTDEQKAVIENAYANYDAEAIKAIAAETAEQVLEGNTTFFTNDTMKDLYKWKAMRDMMEGRIDATSDDEAYQDWFARFTAFEQANDEAIRPSYPSQALDGLGDYSAELTEYFGELARLVQNGLVLEGEDADKVHAYVDAYLSGDDLTAVDEAVMNALKADVYELIADGVEDVFEITIQVACGVKVRNDVIFDEIEDRTMKSAFLLVGEDFTRYLIDDMVPALREDLVAMDKREILGQVAGSDGLEVMGANNTLAYEAMYNVAKAVSEYIEGQDFMDELMGKLANDFGFDANKVEAARGTIIDAVKSAMATLDADHGVELVHFNAYVGRQILNPDMGEVIEVEAGTTQVLDLSFSHPRYAFVGEVLQNFSLEQFDVAYEGECGITAVASEEIGKIDLDATAEGIEDGDEITLYLYRGYDDELNAGDHDAYRYVTTYTVKAVDSTAGEDPYVNLEDVQDPTLDGEVVIKGDTNLDEIKVTVKDENGDVVYEDTHTKEELEEGIEVVLPEGVEPGDDFTVEVTKPGEDDVLAEDDFTVVGAPYVTLEDVLDTTVDGTITVVGTTNLDHVTVAIIKNGETIYAVVYSKAEFEAGITLNAPDGAEVGDAFTVVVGTEKASASDDFAIEGATEEYEVTLEPVNDTTVDGTITVKGTTTNIDHVTVAIVKGGETIYAVVYSKAEFEAGITLDAPDGAELGDVYTVVVGTEKASASDEFEIKGDYVDLEDVQDPTLDGEVVIKGDTNLDEVQVTIKDEDGNVIYDETHTKEELEEGIEVVLPEGVEPGDNFTVEVTKPGEDDVLAEDDFTVVDGPYVTLEDVLDTTADGTITVVGTTNLDHVTVAIVKGEETLYAVVYTKAEFEAGITLNVPDGAAAGDVYTVVVGTEEASDTDDFMIEEKSTEPTPVKPSLSLAGDNDGDGVADRTVKKGSKIDITATPQNIPEGSTAEVVWTIVNSEGEVEQVKVAGDYNNQLVIKGTKVGEGVVVTGTLYIDGVATDATVTVNVTVKRAGGSSSIDKEEPTEEPTTDDGDKTHSCQWPDIAATTTKSAHWAHLTIDQMTINGYINGYPDGLFRPDQNITRAEFSAIVYRILGLQEAEDGVLYDDTVGHWAEDLIATMSLPEGYGMLRGYGDGNFGPNDNITREQAVAIIARAKSAVWVEAEEGAKDVFKDAEDISWWFDGEMDAAVTNGLITGYEDGSYKPLNFTTRAEACVLLARAWPEVLE